MPPRISLEDVWEKIADEEYGLGSALRAGRPADALSHISNLHGWLKVLKRKIQAQKRKEAQGG